MLQGLTKTNDRPEQESSGPGQVWIQSCDFRSAHYGKKQEVWIWLCSCPKFSTEYFQLEFWSYFSLI